jgi:hypothetical protein
MIYKTYINFDIDIEIINKSGEYINITNSISNKLNEEIINKQIGIINSNGNLFSKQFGIIDLCSCKIKQNANFPNRLNFNLFVNNNNKKIEDDEDAEEIIWTVLSIKYDPIKLIHYIYVGGYFFKSKYNIKIINIPYNLYILDYGIY